MAKQYLIYPTDMPNEHKSARILIVEDDNRIAQVIGLKLEELGYVVAAILPAGEEAVAQIAQLRPDLVLMDIMLAGSMDGIEAARKIQLAANIPVIFLTAHSNSDLVARALSTRPFAYLQKPLKERELEYTVGLALLRHGMEAQMQVSRQELEQRVNEYSQALNFLSHELQQYKNIRHRDQLSLQRFSNALDDSADSIYLIDRAKMTFIDVNQTACKRMGYSREELLAMGPHDIKPCLTRSELEYQFDRISASPDRFGIIETYHRCKNRDTYPVEVRLRATEAEGRAIMVAIARDMTIRRRNEQALRLSEEKFHMLFESSPIGLALMNDKKYFTDVNPAFCSMLGYSQDEMIGKNMNDMTHPDDRNSSMEVAEYLFNGAALNSCIEKRYLRKDGEPVWARVHGTIICDKDQRPLYGLGMIENIDHIKQAEAIRRARDTDQKNALVREVHHRIKNHLQGVASLMYQHAQNNSQCSGIIEKAISQINAVATIHGLKGKAASEDIDVLQLLASIRQSLAEITPSMFGAAIRIEGEGPIILDRNESVPVALSLNELLTNAAKHGASPMEISLHCSSNSAVIRIANQSIQPLEKIKPGSGLELVRALLQTEGITFRHEHSNRDFIAEITLSPPVIHLQATTG